MPRSSTNESHRDRLIQEINDRINKALSLPDLLLYAILALVVGGGLGAWWPAMKYWISDSDTEWLPIAYSLSAYLIAILASGTGDTLLLSSEDRPYLKSLRLIASLCIAAGIGLAYATVRVDYPFLSFLISLLGIVIGLFWWIIANCDDPKFQPDLPPDLAIGGSEEEVATKKLSGSDRSGSWNID